MAEVQLKNVSVKHDAILDFMLANPAMRLQDVARKFGVSGPWLSVIVHSDVFQAKLREKSEDMFQGTVIPLRERLLGVAHIAVEKLGDSLEQASPISDKDYIANTADSILKNLGYSPRTQPATNGNAPGVVNNIMVVDKDSLASAREKMRTIQHEPPAPPALSHKEELVEESTVSPAKEL